MNGIHVLEDILLLLSIHICCHLRAGGRVADPGDTLLSLVANMVYGPIQRSRGITPFDGQKDRHDI